METIDNKYNQNLVYAAAYLGMLIFGIVMISLGTLTTFIIDQFHAPVTQVASLMMILPFGTLLGSLIFGPIIDRYGYKSLLVISILLIAGGILGIATLTNFRFIQIAIFIIGFGGGIINGGTNALVADISGVEKGAKLSLLGAFFGIGAFGFPLLVGFLVNYFSYQSIIKAVGLLILLTTGLFACIQFPAPKQKAKGAGFSELKILKSPILLLIGIILFFESGMEGIASNWTALYLTKERGLETDTALYALSFIILGLTAMRLILGFTLKYIRDHIILYVCFGLILTGTLLVLINTKYIIIIAGLTILGAGFGAIFPILLGYLGNLFSEASGTAFSFVFSMALIGNMIINAGVGQITHNGNFHYYLFVLLICLLLQVLTFSVIAKKITTKVKA
ncbi:MAG: MFS transporter [Candidatus Marinimicrobia bacterium]|jgi:fucose permease|nr:MFS transporter [Candidatus Neomarinimicrobiota bacterium]